MYWNINNRGNYGSRAPSTSKMERFLIIVVNYYHKAFHLGVAAVLDPSLVTMF